MLCGIGGSQLGRVDEIETVKQSTRWKGCYAIINVLRTTDLEHYALEVYNLK